MNERTHEAPPAIITLLTDFGTSDAYVAAMKGVILSVNPHATIVDVTHDVPPQDVTAGAWLLRTAYHWFPRGTVHVAVVDPGVGGPRRAIAARAGGWLFVGPDNGVLSWALADHADASFVEVTEATYLLPAVSRTFHGRDIFAPVAAHLSAGVPIEALGVRLDDPVMLPLPRPRIEGADLCGEVVHIDRFGSLITSIDKTSFDAWRATRPGGFAVEVAGRRVDAVAETYADAAPGAVVALFGSAGHLEIAVRQDSAAATIGVARGAEVRVLPG